MYFTIGSVFSISAILVGVFYLGTKFARNLYYQRPTYYSGDFRTDEFFLDCIIHLVLIPFIVLLTWPLFYPVCLVFVIGYYLAKWWSK